MKIDYASHYDDNYWQARKTYRDHAGVEQTYHGPSLAWDGFASVADALREVFHVCGPARVDSALDIGCGGGDLAARLITKGIDAYGIDISEYAVANCVPTMRGRVFHGDITERPVLHRKFDLVMATDLLEHLYEEDLPATFNWMVLQSNRWLFFCVAVSAAPDKSEFVLRKGEEVPLAWEATAVSGHVNVRHWTYWARFFTRSGLAIRWDLMYLFQMEREAVPGWQATPGWNHPTTWILEAR